MHTARARRPPPPPHHPAPASAAAPARPVAGAPPDRPSWLPRRLRPPALLRLTRRPPLRLGGWLATDAAAAETGAAAADGLAGFSAAAASKPSSPAAECKPRSVVAVAGPPGTSDEAVVLGWDDAPLYLHRAGILSGYRVGGTRLSALRALFTPHNEAGNVWTMLIGLAVATALYAIAARRLNGVPKTSLPPLAAALPCGPLLPFRLLYGAVAVHNPASVGLHLWIGRSAGSRRVWRTADVALIQVASVALAVGLSMPLAVEVGRATAAATPAKGGGAGLGGWPLAWWLWLAAVATLFLANVGSTMVFRRVWTIGKARLTRDMAVIVACYLLPMVVHAVWWAVTGAPGGSVGGGGAWSSPLTPTPASAREAAMWGLVAAASVGTGGLLYAKHWPELWAPGRFDVVGHSHQWMHIAAFMAHWAEWRFLAALLLPRPEGGAV
ncbi:hypothetical protein I4F81_001078 [Pyropia yezoensis]|uniref:Uncharacterized protein n=1 Tax=Pyropia yezoensis TaxID=2788 RepID=A0ACC3BKM3_PYRYE|nr:hypothetical protein I4F81_001078 [Neopyropia yezoensis]